MDNKPKIFATCKAGCLWETVHRSEIAELGYKLKMNPYDEGRYFLEQGKTCVIKNKNATSEWGFSACAFDKVKNRKEYDNGEVTLPAFDKYGEVKLKVLDAYHTVDDGGSSSAWLVIDVNGERQTLYAYSVTLDASNKPYAVGLLIEGDITDIYWINDDAEIELKYTYVDAYSKGEVDARFTAIENEISGVEEELQMINEGGVE